MIIMKAAVMQPYFMPYIGYWQLIDKVDTFVLFDDVNYIKKGWINRNRILVNQKDTYFVIPLIKASQNKKINELFIFEPDLSKKKILLQIERAYKKSPYFSETMELLEPIVLCKESNLEKYIENSIEMICQYFSINTKIVISSELKKNNELKAQDKIIDICKFLCADTYVNAIGGRDLYEADVFSHSNLQLQFLQPKIYLYKQSAEDFVAGLSLIDMLFHVKKSDIQKMMKGGTCIDG